MITLVIVSHSNQLAAGVKEIADQMAKDSIPVIAVGGVRTSGENYELGTDALEIASVLREHWNAEGMLLFTDLGSSVMSAELAIEMLNKDQQTRCLLSNAPLVEGAVVAAMEASLGHSLEEVNQAAEAVLQFEKVIRSPDNQK